MKLLNKIKHLLKKESVLNYDIDSKNKDKLDRLNKLADSWKETINWLRNNNLK
jgi:hypothetical protein